MGGGGVPPLSVNFFFVKNRPKNSVFWAKNAVFGGKFVESFLEQLARHWCRIGTTRQNRFHEFSERSHL